MVDLLAKSGMLSDKYKIENASSQTLIKMGDFLNLDLVTGTNIVSTLFNGTVNLPINIMNIGNKIL